MKAQIKVGPKAIIEAEGATVRQVFERVADLAAAFGAATACGCCGSQDIVPHVQRPQTYTYFSLECLACGAQLSFGQTKDGERLFPKRDRGKDGWETWSERTEQTGVRR